MFQEEVEQLEKFCTLFIDPQGDGFSLADAWDRYREWHKTLGEEFIFIRKGNFSSFLEQRFGRHHRPYNTQVLFVRGALKNIFPSTALDRKTRRLSAAREEVENILLKRKIRHVKGLRTIGIITQEESELLQERCREWVKDRFIPISQRKSLAPVIAVATPNQSKLPPVPQLVERDGRPIVVEVVHTVWDISTVPRALLWKEESKRFESLYQQGRLIAKDNKVYKVLLCTLLRETDGTPIEVETEVVPVP